MSVNPTRESPTCCLLPIAFLSPILGPIQTNFCYMSYRGDGVPCHFGREGVRTVVELL
ncbi:MAG: hypothetical protein HLUCCO16_12270 [Phormidium sp. OSCR]|nr:MAG: hypothetical protein HLUCCO16_12270 [Phormidium sp. OSCR]